MNDQKIQKTCVFFLVLIFFSKISFSFLGIIPNQFSFFIYQHGMHPYLNFFFHAILFPPLLWLLIKQEAKKKLCLEYKIFISMLFLVLITQTIFQIFFVNLDQSIFFQLSGLLMALGLVAIYGVFIPLFFDLQNFINLIRKITLSLTVFSLFILLFGLQAFKGGRFVGVFKHIPHMVSVSVIAFIFYLPTFMKFDKQRIFRFLLLMLIVIAIYLTATKTSFIALMASLIFGIFIFPTELRKSFLFRLSFFLSLFVIVVFLGSPIYNLVYDISTGKTELGLRKAQNGVQTRFEEIQRGYDLFQRSPIFGSGLLFKFFKNGQDNVDVDQYNSFKDPHNLYVSSAVIGGAPLFFLSIFATGMMIVSSLRGLFSECTDRKLISLYLLCHIPILIIYHAHFSLGGIADRFYWLIFGYMGTREKFG